MQKTVFEKKFIPQLLTNQNLELILFPTEQCNFRCTYCYEDFSIGKMHDDVVQGVKNLISKRIKELRNLKISWFGGEPLVAKDIVYSVSNYAKELCDENSVNFIAGMTTNGFLLKYNTLIKLFDCGVKSFQISLDGPREMHNQTRLRIDKSGSFDAIWENLIAIQNTCLPVTVTLRIHVTPLNYPTLFLLMEDIKRQFGGDERFKIFFKAISDLGGPNTKLFTTLDYAKQKSIIADLQAAIDGKLAIVSHKNTEIPYVCYAAYGNSFAIRADGRVGKCTVALDSPANTVGRILPDGTLRLDVDKLKPWMRGIQNQDFSALQCPLYGIGA